mgnify:CR=1 FL=1
MADPRTIKAARTVNQELQARAIRHAVDLQKLSNSEVERVLSFLNGTTIPQVRGRLAVLLAELEASGPLGTPTISAALESQLREFEAITASAGRRIAEDETQRLLRIGRLELDFQGDTLRTSIPQSLQSQFSNVFQFTTPPIQTISRIVDAAPILGQPRREWWEKTAAGWSTDIQRTVRSGIVEGRGTSEIIRDVMGSRAAPLDRSVARTMRRQTEAQVRTDINNTVTQAREAFYAENDDLIAGVIWVSTLDGGTTPICRSLDGKFFEVGKGQRPPAHYNCRSTTAPVTKSLKELGIGADDTRGLPDGVRASMGGDVPAKTTYYEWLSGQSKAVQDEVLGPRRAALWRDGRVKAEDFTDDRGRQLTLAELEARVRR